MNTPRIPPVEPPFDPEVAEELARWMPKGAPIEPLALFRTLAQHLPLAQAMLPLGKYLLGRGATIGVRERELVIQRVCARLGCEYAHLECARSSEIDGKFQPRSHRASTACPQRRG